MSKNFGEEKVFKCQTLLHFYIPRNSICKDTPTHFYTGGCEGYDELLTDKGFQLESLLDSLQSKDNI